MIKFSWMILSVFLASILTSNAIAVRQHHINGSHYQDQDDQKQDQDNQKDDPLSNESAERMDEMRQIFANSTSYLKEANLWARRLGTNPEAPANFARNMRLLEALLVTIDTRISDLEKTNPQSQALKFYQAMQRSLLNKLSDIYSYLQANHADMEIRSDIV